jgi:geranylgeranyl pyrophosphate synthase
MKYLLEVYIVAYHKLLVRYIHKDLYFISKKIEVYNFPFTEYESILKKIYLLNAKYVVENKKVKNSKQIFLKALKTSGKGTRIALINFILKNPKIKNKFSNKKDFKNYRIRLCQIIECIHNLSLVVDDALDNDEKRRDKPCIHTIFGLSGVNAFVKYWLDLIFYLILDLPIEINAKINYLKILDSTSTDIIQYVEKEIFWEKNAVEIDWDKIKRSDIEEIYYQKTVRIFLLAFEFIKQSIPIDEKDEVMYINIVTKLGIYLQRINDLENLKQTRPNYLSDILNKRIILINFHKTILDSQNLKDLRNRAYKQNAVVEDIHKYGEALIEYQIPQSEVCDLKNIKREIEKEIKGIFKSKLDETFLQLIFKIYFKKLNQ